MKCLKASQRDHIAPPRPKTMESGSRIKRCEGIEEAETKQRHINLSPFITDKETAGSNCHLDLIYIVEHVRSRVADNKPSMISPCGLFECHGVVLAIHS